MYPCHEARLTPQEQMLDDWLRLDNHFLARGLSLTHHDEPTRTDAQPSRAVSPNPATIQHGGTAAKGIRSERSS